MKSYNYIVKTSLDINIDELITDIYQHYYDVNTNSQNISNIKYIKYKYNQKNVTFNLI